MRDGQLLEKGEIDKMYVCHDFLMLMSLDVNPVMTAGTSPVSSFRADMTLCVRWVPSAALLSIPRFDARM